MLYSTSGALLAITALLFNPVTALGINCRGSGMCSFVHCGGRSCVGQMSELTTLIPDNATYTPGEKILCSPVQKFGNGICMFTEFYGPASGVQVKEAFNYILRWGCAKCGSAPFEPAANDVRRGSLTLNVVHKPNCKGICRVSTSSTTTLSATTPPTIPLATQVLTPGASPDSNNAGTS